MQQQTINLLGQKFGRLTVIARAENNKEKRAMWLCRCECGNEKVVMGKHLRNGETKSCGCLRKENLTTKTHGLCKTPLYKVWIGMRQRCFNKNCESYKNYGGRGITVCQEWNNFQVFYDWANENGYKKGLTIDRINNDGNYEPSNCRWITRKEQNFNKRTNINITFNNKTQSITKWADELNIDISALYTRFIRGWSIEEMLTTPKKVIEEHPLTYNGETKSLTNWAKDLKINRDVLLNRLEKGWSVEEILITPVIHWRKVKCYELNKIYASVVEAAKDIGKKPCGIYKCASGENETAYGYHWEYITGES